VNRGIRTVALLTLALASAGLLAGCASESDGDEMGVWGYLTTASNASIELDESQPGATELLVQRVVAPEPAWLVVHLDDDGMPGERVGIAAVPHGETRSVRIPLDEVTTSSLIVALHADRGEQDVFDFDMENKETSPDRPFFVDGAEVAVVVTVR